MSDIDQLNLAILNGDLEEFNRLYQLIPNKPVEVNLPPRSYENHLLNTFLHRISNPDEKVELVWPTMAKYIQHYHDSEAGPRAYHLLASVITIKYLPDKATLDVHLSEDPSLIKNLREIGWKIKVRRYGGLYNFKELENISDNILNEQSDESFKATIDNSQLVIIEYLNLRGIPYKKIPTFTCGTGLRRPKNS